MRINHWILAFRLRTLPLSLSAIAMGSFLAASAGGFRWQVMALAALTTLLLQILSNLANDYGDSVHGADNVGRKGPGRAVQSGRITAQAMRLAVVVAAVLSLLSGLALLWSALAGSTGLFLLFLGLGVLSIAAAIAYTNGKRPYGYAGWGDVAVLLFFGLIGVGGTCFLHTKSLSWPVLFPALSVGLFSVGVLNINNVRDMESDRAAGKYSIPVRLGRAGASAYQWGLLAVGWLCGVAYIGLGREEGPFRWLFLLCLPLFWKVGRGVQTIHDPLKLDPLLKIMALSTMLYVVAFGAGILL